ncbi:MAG: tail fiber domain-containing protein, partial [Clostridiales bacterium]|nr:tail fiber domain-containing protein [Clostridiales bacterium]
RTVTTYTDETQESSYSIAYQGRDGESLIAVTGVKGNQETQYRTGNVNLTPENLGAVNKSGDTITGDLKVDGDLVSGGSLKVYNDYDVTGLKHYEVDASALDENTWYPVTMGLSLGEDIDLFRIVVYDNLEGDSGTVSWSTHTSKTISCLADWEVLPSGWGRHVIRRVIKFFTYRWGENILGRIDQMSSSSTEYIYVRGGAKYQFYVSPRVGTPTIRTTTYTALDQSISPITSYNGNGWENSFRTTSAIYEDNQRVYSPNNPPPEAYYNRQGTVYGFTSAGSKETTNYTIGATALGYNAIVRHHTGGDLNNCTAIGRDSQVTAGQGNTSYTNSMALGNGATISMASNTIQMGNSSISSFKCKVGVSTTSDERDKTDITVIDNGKALEFITQIDPIQYVDNDRNKYLLREKKIDEETGEETYDDDGANNQDYMRYGMCEYDREAHARGDKKGERKRIGVKAQQIQELLLDIFGSDNYANIVNDDHYDLRADGNAPPVENHLTVTYERLIPFLIGAIKEQQKQITELQKQIGELKNAVAQ